MAKLPNSGAFTDETVEVDRTTLEELKRATREESGRPGDDDSQATCGLGALTAAADAQSARRRSPAGQTAPLTPNATTRDGFFALGATPIDLAAVPQSATERLGVVSRLERATLAPEPDDGADRSFDDGLPTSVWDPDRAAPLAVASTHRGTLLPLPTPRLGSNRLLRILTWLSVSIGALTLLTGSVVALWQMHSAQPPRRPPRIEIRAPEPHSAPISVPSHPAPASRRPDGQARSSQLTAHQTAPAALGSIDL